MQTVRDAAIAFLCGSLAFSVAKIAWVLDDAQKDLRVTMHHANAVLGTTTVALTQSQRILDGTSRNLNAVLIQHGLAADELRRAAGRQGEYHAKALAVLDQTAAAVKQVQDSVKGVGDKAETALGAVERAGVGVTTTLGEISAHIGTVADAAEKQIANPEIGQAVTALRQASEATAGAAVNVQEATKSVDAALRPLRTTGGRLKAVLRILLGIVKVDLR